LRLRGDREAVDGDDRQDPLSGEVLEPEGEVGALSSFQVQPAFVGELAHGLAVNEHL
jgi:hypothetical protein